jgi:class 3 adenylate cyclase
MKPEDVDQFLGLPKGSFEHIPNYAREAAMHAIANVRKLEEQKLFRPGLYYIVLIDLSSSTKASETLGTELNQKRVQTFVTASVEALGNIELSSYAQFLKEIGDATLFIFSSFEDLYAWWRTAVGLFWSYNKEWEDEIEDGSLYKSFIIRAKTVVHLGEVSYITHGNPLSLAVNQVFKIEKLFKPSQLGCTEAVRLAASPHFRKFKIRPKKGSSVILPGEEEKSPTWILEGGTG